MAKLIFMPISILTGLLAGIISKKVFALIWGRIDEQDPPQPQNRRADFGKLAVSLALEGALFRLVKGLVDNSSRRGFASVTGAWPGDREPEPE
jgi:Protein of unknown function (DUF4235)